MFKATQKSQAKREGTGGGGNREQGGTYTSFKGLESPGNCQTKIPGLSQCYIQ